MSEHTYEFEDGRATTYTLDATHKCGVEGCEWTIKLGADRCCDHGGQPADTLYVTSETGETTYFVDAGDPIV